ncbi:Z-ring associated protein ZapG [Aliivibrio sp. S3MY1]|uniref:Z-ring associated protein ZapG n=1 Tax=unclassified Aliivibrio TaxID=2645654 RepID=UPI00237A01C1|nr:MULTISPECIES: Z-ring associated protein ZapG [unclassified Aliivibrio]MDD9195236.1 Z-ring associated protein ZapG [Aliivibrio sp. S3MY1]MDD9197801.1 Z-ring associated protein ZapG [Aliivibrio sp. S2MY1]
MAWTYALIGLAIGIIIGFLISRVTVPGIKHQKTLKQDLEKSKYELEQYRQELVDHFATSATMLEALAKDFNKMYDHMASTSKELLPNLPEQDNPFSARLDEMTLSPELNKKVAHIKEEIDSQPKDYANGASGLLKDEPLSDMSANKEEKIA